MHSDGYFSCVRQSSRYITYAQSGWMFCTRVARAELSWRHVRDRRLSAAVRGMASLCLATSGRDYVRRTTPPWETEKVRTRGLSMR